MLSVFFNHSLPYVLRKCLPLNLEFDSLASPAGQLTLKITNSRITCSRFPAHSITYVGAGIQTPVLRLSKHFTEPQIS